MGCSSSNNNNNKNNLEINKNNIINNKIKKNIEDYSFNKKENDIFLKVNNEIEGEQFLIEDNINCNI